MNRVFFSGWFLAGSLWGAGVYNYMLKCKDKPDTSDSADDNEDPQHHDDHHIEIENQILKYGSPTQSPLISHYRNHLLNYDQEKKIPRWVAEDITASKLVGPANRKHSKFISDTAIPEKFRSLNSDFWKSGWSRGHMAPAGNYKLDQASMDDTFLLSNILPQDIQNNNGFWNRFEMYCRDLTKKYTHVRIISGPVMLPNVEEDGKLFVKYQVVGKTKVAVPTHLYKVVVAENDASYAPPLVGAFIVPNVPLNYSHKLVDYQIPLEELEVQTGLSFLPKLDLFYTRDLCAADGCKLMEKDEYELWILNRKMLGARSVEKLDQVWDEIVKKNLNVDDYTRNLYSKKKSELSREE